MDYKIEGKLCFVTAGAHGIGRAIADLLTAEGGIVVVADMDESALRESGAGWKGVVAADLSTGNGVTNAVAYVLKTFGRAPDILINNVGIADANSLENISDEKWMWSFNINLMACVRTCRALLPQMAEIGSGAVVNTASDIGLQPEPGLLDYGTFKSALLHVTKALAKQYAPRVRVNAVSPGPIWTRLFYRPGGIVDQIADRFGIDRDAAIKKFLEDRYLPFGIGQPEDVAHAVVFLASPLAKYISGANIDLGGTLQGAI